jgi:molybdenum cofactor cytidylyltransferase
MGRNKLLLRIEGESLVRRIARRALAAGLDPVVVVLGRDAEDAERELADLPLSIVVNAGHEAGIHTSRRAGLAAVPSDRDAAIVLLADMPFVTQQMLAALVARYRDTGARLVFSDYAGESAPPNLYDRSLFAELAELQGEGRAGPLAQTLGRDAVAMHWPASAICDLDHPEDYDRLLAESRNSGGAV